MIRTFHLQNRVQIFNKKLTKQEAQALQRNRAITRLPIKAFAGRRKRMLESGRSANVTADVSCRRKRTAVVFLRLEDDDVDFG